MARSYQSGVWQRRLKQTTPRPMYIARVSLTSNALKTGRVCVYATPSTMSEPYGSTADAQSATSVSQKHILFSEILSTTSVMRKNARWATSASSFVGRDSALASSLGLRVSAPSPSTHTAVRGSREKDLMAGFQVLKRTVGESDGAYISLPRLCTS